MLKLYSKDTNHAIYFHTNHTGHTFLCSIVGIYTHRVKCISDVTDAREYWNALTYHGYNRMPDESPSDGDNNTHPPTHFDIVEMIVSYRTSYIRPNALIEP